MITTNKTTEEILWSKFLSRHASFVLEKIQQKTTFHLSSSQNPNLPSFSTQQNSSPNNLDHRSKRRPSSNFTMNLLPYGLGHTENFGNVAGPLPMNQNNAQDFNFFGTQFQNLAFFEDSYLGSSFSSNKNYYDGFSVGVDGGISTVPNGISNGFDGNYVGNFDAMGVENFMGFETMQRYEFDEYGIGFEEENSYNWGLMCNNGVNFGGDYQITMRHSSHAHENKVCKN